MRLETLKVFDKICMEKHAFFTEGIGNPIKIVDDIVIIYCLQKGEIFECIIDLDDLDKLRIGSTWVINNSKLSKRPRPVAMVKKEFTRLYHIILPREEGKVTERL